MEKWGRKGTASSPMPEAWRETRWKILRLSLAVILTYPQAYKIPQSIQKHSVKTLYKKGEKTVYFLQSH
jgi:hypothetical protein